MENHNIIDSHRNMLMVSKNLSDFQLENLRQWPLVFFNGVEQVRVDYSFIDVEDNFFAGNITFDLKIPNPEQDLTVPIAYLDAATKLMFWSDTHVIIKVNGEIWNKTKSKNTKKTSRKKKANPSKNSSKADVPA